MGHSSSYHTVKELETEMAFEANKSNKVSLFWVKLKLDVGTRVAWGNYDRYVEIQNGRDTLHDTFGITYQLATKCDDISINKIWLYMKI